MKTGVQLFFFFWGNHTVDSAFSHFISSSLMEGFSSAKRIINSERKVSNEPAKRVLSWTLGDMLRHNFGTICYSNGLSGMDSHAMIVWQFLLSFPDSTRTEMSKND